MRRFTGHGILAGPTPRPEKLDEEFSAGVVEGMKIAAALIEQMAADKFLAEEDEAAEVLRDAAFDVREAARVRG